MKLKKLLNPTKTKVLWTGAFFVIAFLLYMAISIVEAMICYECYFPESRALVEVPILILLDALLVVLAPVIGIGQFISHATVKSMHFGWLKGSLMYIHWIVQVTYMYILACLFVERKKKRK